MGVLKARIVLVPKEEFEQSLNQARNVSPDPDDSAYFALALQREIPIWSDNRELQDQDQVDIKTTEELVDKLSF